MDFEKYIGVTEDFPKKGISFKDISPLLANPDAFQACIDEMAKIAEEYHIDYICGPESRAFLLSCVSVSCTRPPAGSYFRAFSSRLLTMRCK